MGEAGGYGGGGEIENSVYLFNIIGWLTSHPIFVYNKAKPYNMPVPDYQTLMLPLLKLVSDRKEYKLNDAVDILGAQFNLTDEEKSELTQG